jgi:hypothetical protein
MSDGDSFQKWGELPTADSDRFVRPSKIFVWGSRRQLTLILDKPAFSRISQTFQTTIRGSEFQGIREKAGLSKMGVRCLRLVWGAYWYKDHSIPEKPTHRMLLSL